MVWNFTIKKPTSILVLGSSPTGSRLVEKTLEKIVDRFFSQKGRTLKIWNFFRRDPNDFFFIEVIKIFEVAGKIVTLI